MTGSALILSALTGLQLGWTVAPATASGSGSITVDAMLEEHDLVFVTEDGAEAASFEAVASLPGNGGGFARSGGTIARADLPFTQRLVLNGLEAGRYDLVLMLRDLESGRTTVREATVEVPARVTGNWSSSMVRIEGGTLRISGSADVAWQVFPPEGEEIPDSLTAAFLLRGASGATAAEGWMEESGGVFSGTIPLESVPAGDYELVMAAVLGSEIQTASVLSIEVEEDWDLWGRDAKVTAELVRPIAESGVLGDLENADSESGRRAVMSQFWKDHDPTPMTVENEFLDQYLERLDYISKKFSRAGTPGIDTDMGRVYALLGEPDMLEDMPFETGNYPYQVWTYFTPSITVLFVDEYGVGMYDLHTPWRDIRRAYERM